ncbi:glucose-1-phosphate adenylyltransferase subunit GlgD [Pontibacillus yanchengensis]|uniref:Glucose-1-phosphate adenylyltransferase subunit GlgD n=2 Tax=Pontibacillus yanchengensis TaxID=462910 RepID=A0ACC7VHP5_9BACI|nr:glucose-1-phosphate adenylyltransferase subunit GlgD [Pontibacillus yanchengensis]MYL34495.1 glucose-1-phosphate adenylyltransferase subunit GlgD [Pontibacillus yanchengensis]MYL54303.1 glucose-1-phosphate adenylyltransferase subunit GlgD [Pontibacillus yanchengensis]
MDRIAGIINLDHEQDLLDELTYFRCGAAVPFGGRYRMIDFAISNMANSRIESIAVFARRKYRSLMDHLEQGKAWDLDRRSGGLFILPPDWNDPTDISRGDLQHFHNNMDFINRARADYILVSGSQNICNINFQDVLEEHKATNADVTVIYKDVDELYPEHRLAHKLSIDEQNRVLDIHNDQKNTKVYMDMYLVEKNYMNELIEASIAHGHSHFFLEGIKGRLQEMNVHAYEYKGTHALVNSIESYFRNSRKLLDREEHDGLFKEDSPILTKVKNEAPAKYLQDSDVKNTLVANGCLIHGHVEDSILFRGVKIGKGAVVKNSIIMQRCEVEDNAVLENVIIDKDCKITGGRTFIGAPEKPYVLAKRKSM